MMLVPRRGRRHRATEHLGQTGALTGVQEHEDDQTDRRDGPDDQSDDEQSVVHEELLGAEVAFMRRTEPMGPEHGESV